MLLLRELQLILDTVEFQYLKPADYGADCEDLTAQVDAELRKVYPTGGIKRSGPNAVFTGNFSIQLPVANGNPANLVRDRVGEEGWGEGEGG